MIESAIPQWKFSGPLPRSKPGFLYSIEKDVIVTPFSGLLHQPAGSAFHCGGPSYSNFEARSFERHNRYGKPADIPPDLSETSEMTSLRGAFVWGGAACDHFGHQIADFSHRLLISRSLFPELPLLVAVSKDAGIKSLAALPSFVQDVYSFVGYDVNSVRIVTSPVMVDDLVVCEQGQQIGTSPSRDYLDLIARNMRRNFASSNGPRGSSHRAQRVFVSRIDLPPAAGRSLGEAYISKCMKRAGFSLYSPGSASYKDQLKTYINADVLVFAEGSGLHGLDFLTDLKEVVLLQRRLKQDFSDGIRLRSQSFTCVDRIRWIGTASPNQSPVRGVSFIEPSAMEVLFRDLGLGYFDHVEYGESLEADFERYLGAPLWQTLGGSDHREKRFASLRNTFNQLLAESGLATVTKTSATKGAIVLEITDEGSPILEREITVEQSLDVLNPSARRLNKIIKTFGAKRYLEIGVQKGVTFQAVICDEKVGVDPNFLFDTEEASREPGNKFYKRMSDDYFIHSCDEVFDVIFLDGHHTFEQTYRDMCNALLCSHAKTVLLIDDVIPSDVYSSIPEQSRAISERQRAGFKGKDWHGDVYKVIFALNDFYPLLSYRTIVGGGNSQTVVWRGRRPNFQPRFSSLEAIERLTYFDLQNNMDLMNVDTEENTLAAVREAANLQARFVAGVKT